MSKVQRGLGKGVGAIFGGVPNADQLRKQAEGRLEEAASLIVRKVVDA